MARSKANETRHVLNIGTTTTLGFDAKPRCVSSRSIRGPTLQGTDKRSAHSTREASGTPRVPLQPHRALHSPVLHLRQLLWFSFSDASESRGIALACVSERRLHSGWDSVKFLVAEAGETSLRDPRRRRGRRLGLVLRQRPEASRLHKLALPEGTDEFVLEEPLDTEDEPSVPVLTDTGLSSVADLPSRRRCAEPVERNAGPVLPLRRGAKVPFWQQGRPAWRCCQLRAGLHATC